jgi:diguanylate cyclase
MPTIPGPDFAVLPALTVPTAAAILLFAAGMAVLLAHALHKARSQDWVVALGWALGGSVATATALWSLMLLGWLTFAGAGGVRAEPFAAAWGVAFGGCLLAVLASRVLPSHRAANPLVVALMLPTWVVVFVVLGSALERPPNWQALAAGPTLAALAAAGIGLAVGLQTVHGPRRRWARRAIGQRVAGVAVIALGVLVAQAIALRSLPLPVAAAVPGGERLDGRMVWIALAFGAFCVVMALLCAAVDSRSGRRAHALAGSLQLANRRLRELAFRDALSGLPNRLHFEERLDETLDAVGRQYAAMAVLFIDLDGFKAVNESFGHGAGDEVLREVGRRLHGVARAQDTAARIGGDEFLLLVAAPGSHEVAAQVAQQTLHALMAPYHLANAGGGTSEVRLSCSIGIAVFPEHGPTSRLIGNADAAMLAVKRTGGSTYAFYDTRMDQDSGEALELQTDLRQAIERHELALFYQPKIDARTRELTGVEALVRWTHAVRGAVGPAELIAVAERFGLIGAVGQWVIDEACRQVRAWGDQGLRMRVAVNLSAHQLRQDDLVPRIRQSIDAHGIDASLLTFEITESVAMEDTQITMRSFAQLARAGVSLAIDDFGTGHSSLAYLRTLPAQQLKIDRSFIGDLGVSGDAMAVVDAVIRLAHALGLRVVAEGVETERQCEILTALGCDEFQGFLFARPMDAERLAIWASGEASTREFLERTQPVVRDGEEPRLLQ